MRIVLFDYVFDRDKPGASGLSDLVWNWASHLTTMGDEVHIVAPYLENARPPTGAIVHRYALPPIGYRNILGHVLIVLWGWLEIRKLGPIDLIHSPEYLSTGIFSLLMRRTPVILTVPGSIYERIKNGNPFDWWTTQALKVAARISARFCARIIVTSGEMWYWWKKIGTSVSRLTLIPYGVNIDQFHPIPDAKSSLGIPHTKRIVLYVGRLSHEKGLQYLLPAFQHVARQTSDVQLHVVGDGPLREKLATMAQDIGIGEKVVFHGWVPQNELPTFYSAADVVVLPSLSEGLPRTMLEAMACSAPFVGTNISGIRDWVIDGETGLMAPPADIDGLACCLDRLLYQADYAQQLGRAASNRIQRDLAWNTITLRIRTEVYLSCVQS